MQRFEPKLLEQAKKLLSSFNKIVIVPHTNPDGDAMGASIGLHYVLTALGKSVTIVSPTDFPEYLKWTDVSKEVVIFEWENAKAKRVMRHAEMIVYLDFNDIKRTGSMENELVALNKPSIMIDHHPYPKDIAIYSFSDTTSSSTCELVVDFVYECGWKESLCRTGASSLFMGILTDTGGFAHNSSNPNLYRVVGLLMEKKVDKDYIYSKVFHQFSANRLRLMGYAISEKMTVLEDLSVSYITLTKEELEKYQFQSGDTEGVVNEPLQIKGMVCSVLFMEKDGFIKISFRSKGDFPVNEISEKYFHGGGHLNAAGGRSNGTLLEATQKFEKVIQEYRELLINEMQKLK
ncbi:bifunctional oligoribonuclease/PAP phosphatase NrnA [Halosquirtibacter laminarini]|uniref:Bifunctional oligoribonuclease/PAP phosphatase NrnA n=1 Tax=Halosquirtibacter laminarini TaxID=3374600 RepID=A0AC61NIP6_9BACT|nr:bifunctional oligoribonuclease/PAP phosphatase NrnA [Prolixibacteraceae bacterium]